MGGANLQAIMESGSRMVVRGLPGELLIKSGSVQFLMKPRAGYGSWGA